MFQHNPPTGGVFCFHSELRFPPASFTYGSQVGLTSRLLAKAPKLGRPAPALPMGAGHVLDE